MSCANHDFTACRGGTFRETVVYKDALSVPIDISGWTALWTVGGDTFVSDGVNVTVGPEAGTVHLVLTSVQIEALGFQQPYLLVLRDPAFDVGLGDTPLLEGKISVE